MQLFFKHSMVWCIMASVRVVTITEWIHPCMHAIIELMLYKFQWLLTFINGQIKMTVLVQ